MSAKILPFSRPEPRDYAAGYLDGIEDAKELCAPSTWFFGFLAGAAFSILVALLVLLLKG